MSLRIVLLIMLALLLGACTGSPGADGDDPGPSVADGAAGDGDEAGDGEGGDGGEGMTTVRVEVQAGPMAGSYEAEGDKLDCNVSDTGSGATFSDFEITNNVAMFTFIASDGSNDPEDFSLDIQLVGEESMSETFQAEQQIAVNTGLFETEEEGGGTARRTDNGDQITWDIEGTSAEGHDFTASITCGPVDRR